MTTLKSDPYWGITREELREARRRAHAERTKLARPLFAALVSWRRKAFDWHATAEPALKAAHKH